MNAIPETQRSGSNEGALGRERNPRAHGAAAPSSPSATRSFIAESAAQPDATTADPVRAGSSLRRDRPPQRHVAADTTPPEAPPCSTSAVDARTEPVLLSEMDRTGTAPPRLAVARTLRRDPCENSISEAELLRAYEGAAPWSPEMR